MYMNSRGAVYGDTSCMVDPSKVGRILWARSKNGYMVPVDLHNRLQLSDEEGMDRVYRTLIGGRKVRPALDIVYDVEWKDLRICKPYLIMTMEVRAQAREMMVTGEWSEFWTDLDQSGVQGD